MGKMQTRLNTHKHACTETHRHRLAHFQVSTHKDTDRQEHTHTFTHLQARHSLSRTFRDMKDDNEELYFKDSYDICQQQTAFRKNKINKSLAKW